MSKKKSLLWLLFLTLLIISTTANQFVASAPITTTVSIQPSSIKKTVGSTFTVNVTVSNSLETIAWEFTMAYNKTTLEALNVAEGKFLQGFFVQKINNTAGTVQASDMLLSGSVPAGSSGVLATITFKIKNSGTTVLAINPVTDSRAYVWLFKPPLPGQLYTPNTYNESTVTGEYASVNHKLTVNSAPITGVSFTLDGVTYKTPWSGSLREGLHTVIVPISVTVSGKVYDFKRWEDGSTNPTRLISLITDLTISATYELHVTHSTSVVVNPSQAKQTHGNFTISVNIADSLETIAWEFKMTYEPTVLEALSVAEGNFIQGFFSVHIDNVAGIVQVSDLLLSGSIPAGSSGVLATVTFNVLGTSGSVLAINPVTDSRAYVWLFQPPANASLLYTPNKYGDGTFIFCPYDVDVTNVTPYSPLTYQGVLINVYVDVMNMGTVTATFNVTLRVNSTAIGAKRVTDLAAKTSATLSFVWDTTSSLGRFVLSATVSALTGEVNLDDNTLSDGIVEVRFRGDLDGDGRVGPIDLSMFTASYGKLVGNSLYNPLADLDGSGYIGPIDLSIFAAQYGRVVHNVAVLDVTPSVTFSYRGNPVTIYVDVKNTGENYETFEVTAYANSTVIGKQTLLNVAPKAYVRLTFTWSTSGMVVGHYTISASIPPVANEAYVGDNNLFDGVVEIRFLGDLDGDGFVGPIDLSVFAASYGKRVGDLLYNPAADMDADGDVDPTDLNVFAANYGKHV